MRWKFESTNHDVPLLEDIMITFKESWLKIVISDINFFKNRIVNDWNSLPDEMVAGKKQAYLKKDCITCILL